MDVRLPDGTVIQNVPDNITKADLTAKLASNGYDVNKLAGQPTQNEQTTNPTEEQKIRASEPVRLGVGMFEPMVGIGQLLSHGISAVSPKGSYGEGLAGIVDNYWRDQAAKQEEAKQKLNVGTDVAGFVGNVFSPANALLAAKGITAVGTGMRMLQGGALGAAAGASQPVLTGDNYASSKTGQVGLGAITGGVMTGLLDKAMHLPVVQRVIQKVSGYLNPADTVAANANAVVQTDKAIGDALKEINVDPASVNPAQLQAIREQVLNGLKTGKQLDAAALLRKQDFESLGMQPLTGQITRDPLQFAQERNLRGVVPELATRLQTQGQQVRDKIGNFANGASDNYTGGNTLINALRKTDESMQGNVHNLYQQARQSAGRDLDVPLTGLAQDYAMVLQDFGDKVPSGVRNHFNDLGLLTGKQNKVFTVEEADNLLKVINSNVGNDPATNNALTQLRGAVKNAVTGADASGGVFAPAVKAAAERFKLQDAIPALEASSNGTASADNFVQRYIVNGSTDQVKGMAKILPPASLNEARSQVGETLRRAAYGENIAGDAAFSAERYAKALRQLGQEKLSAFYTPSEIEQLNRLARVGSYINKLPDVAPVNTSNTFTAAAMNSPLISNLLGMIPGKGVVVGAAKAATGAVKNQMAASNAMNAKIPSAAAELTPYQNRLIQALLGTGAVSGGLLAADAFK